MSFNSILDKYRQQSFSQRDKGERFERLMQAYLLTDPLYASKLKKVWLWSKFHGKYDLGGSDTGIDLVALTVDGDYWAIQCKCFQETSPIDKPAVDSFLSTSSRKFKNEQGQDVSFSLRLWISTTNRWGVNAEEAIRNQHPPVSRLNLYDLQQAPVDWEKMEKGIHGEASRISGRDVRPHQKEALDKTHVHFASYDRGKLVMACGTGKTFTSLRIAENETGGNGMILFLVPSIALLGQTLREWSTFANEPINAVCICSDPEISRKKTKIEDTDNFSVVDLALPASTDTDEILRQFKHIKTNGTDGLTVVFSTYQSIEVIARAQKVLIDNGYGDFDLIICDEAHRTTGVTIAGEDESAFTKVHNNEFIRGKKRLYMTATPRLYSDDSKSKAAQADAPICSMDDETLYGEEIYRIGFGEAVDNGLLTDYKVLILTLNEQDVPPAVQKMISDEKSEINADDASKLIGCVNALSKQVLGDHAVIKESDPNPMKRAVAFCANITTSKKITATFNTATDAYITSLPRKQKEKMVEVESKHIDGTMNAPDRDQLLGWLKEDTPDGQCRILTNVRCLSEGVDVPSLDAVMFLSARNSQVDVVQSVGRVMRRADGKKYGYIIIPVVIPANVEPEKALDDNERYKVVWTVLNALRAHDDRFNATVNKIDLNKKRPPQIIVGGTEYGFDGDGNPIFKANEDRNGLESSLSRQLALQFEQLQNVIFARMVTKVGDKRYWEVWAKNVAEIAERQTSRIKTLVTEDKIHKKEFEDFLSGLQTNINPSISEQEAIEMLSQHIITKPVFEALFEGYSFVKSNAISLSMQSMLDLLEEQSFDKDAETLQKFYDSVKTRAAGIDNAEGKQRIIIELYDKFFKTAFPKMVEKLGIVYTPVEVVDFIIHSVNDILKKEFGRSISDENVHVLDPFTGTGTFITRLLQSGLIELEDLERKYKHELHANEIVLLAYYIAAVNIENAYHDATPDPNDGIGKENYTPFDGIVLTDTFQLGETDASERLISEMFPQNSERVLRQKNAPLRVIIGNPPYSVGQKSANDNAQNQEYPRLDSKIESTYARQSKATSVKALYDSYIKAFRWSTERLDNEDGGIICFVSNGAWIDSNGMDGFRKSLEKEFSAIYVFNLRGNQRTSGELSRKEGGKIFGSGSRTPIAITLLVKNQKSKNSKAEIFYYDIGDYLNREEKLEIVSGFGSFANKDINFTKLSPNDQGDWIAQRNNSFGMFLPMNPEKKYDLSAQSYFVTYSLGLATGRDAWVSNSSQKIVISLVTESLEFYNLQVKEYSILKNSGASVKVDDFIDTSPKKISWNRNLKEDIAKLKSHSYNSDSLYVSNYRPFFKQYLYFDKDYNAMLYQNKRLFPKPDSKNLIICVSPSQNDGLSVLIADSIANLHFNGDTQAFPLYYYEEIELSNVQHNLFSESTPHKLIRYDGITNFILDRARSQYGKNIEKEDIFYYVYGFLHSPKYRLTFGNDLKKMLPRLPLVDDIRDFWAFSNSGRRLADLHLNYETVEPHEGITVTLNEIGKMDAYEFHRVDKMRFPRKSQTDTIIYNSRITVTDIPAKAYEYVINGKSAIDWIMERYAITVHKDSGIVNDPNDWSREHEKPAYILDLLLSVINVSVQTVDIVNALPRIDFSQNIENQTETTNFSGMKEFGLSEGIYSIIDAAAIIRQPVDKVRRWFTRLSEINYEGLDGNSQQDIENRRISFHGLIELVVIGELIEANFNIRKIFAARTDLAAKTGKTYPFATNNVNQQLKVSGSDITWDFDSGNVTLNGKGQFNLNVVREFFRDIEFDTSGIAQRILPAKGMKRVEITPKMGGGKPSIVDSKGVNVETIMRFYTTPGDIDDLISEYGISKEDIEAAIAYQS